MHVSGNGLKTLYGNSYIYSVPGKNGGTGTYTASGKTAAVTREKIKIANGSSKNNAGNNLSVNRIVTTDEETGAVHVTFQGIKQTSFSESLKNYSNSIRSGRLKAQDTTLQLKKMKYNFKNISSKILRSKTSASAKRVVSEAKREVLKLKRQRQGNEGDAEEIDAAIAHAKAMERVAKKKVKHLEQEEIAKASGGPLAEYMEEESDYAYIYDDSYAEISIPTEDMIDAYIESMENLSDLSESISEVGELTAEMMDDFEEGIQEMLEEMGLDELSESLTATKGDMDPNELKLMKIKHRAKEMKDIVKADADYLKVVFKQMSMQATSPSIDISL